MDTLDGSLADLPEVAGRISRASDAIDAVEHWLWENVVANDALPRSLPSAVAEPLVEARARLQEARNTVMELTDDLRDRPLTKLLNGYALTPNEYYILRALGVLSSTVKALGLGAVDDYDAFSMLHYEDDRLRTYINPEAPVRGSGRVGARFGRPPEELELSALRAEQHRFFAQHLPAVLVRFRGSGSDAPITG